jgi:hypothetical protein
MVLLTLAACGGGDDLAANDDKAIFFAAPVECATAYCEATERNDMAAFLGCVIISERAETEERWVASAKNNASVSMVVQEIIGSVIDGDRAAVHLKVAANSVPGDFVLSLVRVDGGGWLVTRKTHTDLAAQLKK